MQVIESLRLFHRRRIDIPAGPDSLVLDVGSGDKPHWRADVLLDRFIDAEHAGQRSGRRAARISRPLFDADAASMPFATGAFDYSICSHVLEHVVDPGAVIDELVRVSRAGYIEVPEAASAKILDFPSHLWFVRLDGSTLVFTAKTAPYFDRDIHDYLQRAGIEGEMADLLDSRFEHRIVQFRWEEGIDYRIEGSPPAALVEHAMTTGGHQRVAQSIAARLLTTCMTLPLRAKRRSDHIRFDDVVAPAHRTGDAEFLKSIVYRLDGTAP